MFGRGIAQEQCIDQLTSTFGDEAPSKTTVDYCLVSLTVGYLCSRTNLKRVGLNQQRRIILYHDNASFTSAETARFLEGQKIKLAGHPPYSPDPSLKYIFLSVKMKLRGQHFSSREETVDTFKMHVLEIPQSELKSAINISFSVCKSANKFT
ncbi:hypothetical protein EVAR_10583_1 [Eumeta japonica]|uniref:Mariner Mos1 transposase n=1 Tax=Eumeta variegata TaxID=151549 RepID=A0A4C1U1Y6_EUMVA|nr:hypothetical protein EVAR_10583_1 [Eumeta japonica]